MKVLLTIYDIQDYGGIVSHTENLALGFREHGHECDLVLLRDTDRDPYIKRFNKEVPGDYPSAFGGMVNTLRGWSDIPVRSFHPSRVDDLKRYMEDYDLVIHEIPSPGEDHWPWAKELYRAEVVQIIAAHDAHYREFYPHINDVADHIAAITTTNHAGYVALEECPIPRAFVGAPHVLQDWDEQRSWRVRHPIAVCAHVWKAWKHMDKVVAAGPLLNNASLVMAGDGIEGRYMRSVDKCKPKYEGLWRKFKQSEQCEYLGLISNERLMQEYLRSRVMVDLSYSKKFAKLGNHFNRSIIEAANGGCVSICTEENMRENNPQVPLFFPDVNYISTSKDISIKDLAALIEWSLFDFHRDDHANMLESIRMVLSTHFDHRLTPLHYIDLAQGKPAGVYPVLEQGYSPRGTGLTA